jgi:hypothetical protein
MQEGTDINYKSRAGNNIKQNINNKITQPVIHKRLPLLSRNKQQQTNLNNIPRAPRERANITLRIVVPDGIRLKPFAPFA